MGKKTIETSIEKTTSSKGVVVSDPTVTVILPDEFVNLETKITDLMLRNIGEFIVQGLNEEEACLLANFDYDVFLEAKKRSVIVANYIRKQLIKLKQKHLKVIQENPSDKNSQWILEKVFPEEYGSSKKKDAESNLGQLAAIIKAIQHDPNSHIIRDVDARDVTGGRTQVAAAIDVAEALG